MILFHLFILIVDLKPNRFTHVSTAKRIFNIIDHACSIIFYILLILSTQTSFKPGILLVYSISIPSMGGVLCKIASSIQKLNPYILITISISIPWGLIKATLPLMVLLKIHDYYMVSWEIILFPAWLASVVLILACIFAFIYLMSNLA